MGWPCLNGSANEIWTLSFAAPEMNLKGVALT